MIKGFAVRKKGSKGISRRLFSTLDEARIAISRHCLLLLEDEKVWEIVSVEVHIVESTSK